MEGWVQGHEEPCWVSQHPRSLPWLSPLRPHFRHGDCCSHFTDEQSEGMMATGHAGVHSWDVRGWAFKWLLALHLRLAPEPALGISMTRALPPL